MGTLLRRFARIRARSSVAATPGREAGWVALFATLLAAWVWWPAVAAYPRTLLGATVSDAPYYHGHLEAMRVSIARYGELPLWNPFECGGVPLWDDPQSPIGAPLAWLALAFGTAATIPIWYAAHTAAAAAGMYLLARRDLGASPAAACASGAIWSCCGFAIGHAVAGHLTFAPFAYLPLALVAWHRVADRRFAVALGLLFACMFYEGAAYPLPMFALFLGVDLLARLAVRATSIAIAIAIALRGAAVAGVTFVGLAAARVFPVVAQLASHTRTIGHDGDRFSAVALLEALASRGVGAHGHWGWHEYECYVGAVALLFALVGAARVGARHPWLLAVAAFAAILSLGCFAQRAPWPILNHYVYPFKEMRVPSRFVVGACFALAALAGAGLDALLRARGQGRRRLALRIAGASAALLVVADVASFAHGAIAGAFAGPRETHPAASERLHYDADGRTNVIDRPSANRGRLACDDEWGFGAGAPLWTGDVAQARVASPGAVVTDVVRTQNTFRFDVAAVAPTRVLLNSTFDAGWRASEGTLVDDRRRLALDLPAGARSVRVWYWPRGLTLGLATTAATIALALGALLARAIAGLRASHAPALGA